MNLNDIQKHLAEKLQVSQTEARKIYDTVVEMVTEEVKTSQEDVTLPGIVVFKKTAKPEGTARNPKTGEQVTVAAHTQLKARPVESLKKMVR